MGLGAQVADDVAQALQTGQLPQAEGDELRPAAHHAESLALLVLSGLGVEFMSGSKSRSCRKTVVMMRHGLDLPSFERLGAKSFYQTEKVQAGSSRPNLKFYGTAVVPNPLRRPAPRSETEPKRNLR